MSRNPLPVASEGPPVLVLVTGSRQWQRGHAWAIHSDLEVIEATGRLWAVIEGDAQGADRIAGRGWASKARRRGVGWVSFPADWSKHGKKAGPIRNLEMLDYARKAIPLGVTPVVLGYPVKKSIGTRHMMDSAWRADVRVFDRSWD